MIIFSINNSHDLAQTIAKKLKAKYAKLVVDDFPDKELYLRYPVNVSNKAIVLVESFQPVPDWSLYTVFFAARTARDLGAKKIILVAPYLAFMRQDKRFNPGEAVTSKIMAELLNYSIDHIITIDTHLHRYNSLRDVFNIPAKNLTANSLIADYIKKTIKNPVIVGPDSESYQWAEQIASEINAPCTVLEKTRFSSRKVAVKIRDSLDFANRAVVIVDDIISTGHTVVEAAKAVKKLGTKTIIVIGVHGLLIENAVSRLKQADVDKIITTNTIKSSTNVIDVSSILAKELLKCKLG